MIDRKPREKVVAEISVSSLVETAAQARGTLSPEEALAFLQQNGRAYDLWKKMMHAGEQYIRTSLQAPPVLTTGRSSRNAGRVAV